MLRVKLTGFRGRHPRENGIFTSWDECRDGPGRISHTAPASLFSYAVDEGSFGIHSKICWQTFGFLSPLKMSLKLMAT